MRFGERKVVQQNLGNMAVSGASLKIQLVILLTKCYDSGLVLYFAHYIMFNKSLRNSLIHCWFYTPSERIAIKSKLSKRKCKKIMIFHLLKASQTFRAYQTESYIYSSINAGSNTEIWKTQSLLSKILLSISTFLPVYCGFFIVNGIIIWSRSLLFYFIWV